MHGRPSADPRLADLRANLNSVLLGNERAVDVVVATVLARGHVLLQDQPGVGKTLLARALARSLGGTFGRVQGSPDLLPADVVGITVPDRVTGEWVYRPGPIVNHVVLFDELNRATPRAQSALFEAMAERQITADGTTRPLPDTFAVVATQNPSGHAGTFPLPEGQLDRFWTATDLAPPTRDVEVALVDTPPGYGRADVLEPVFTPDEFRRLQALVDAVPMATHVAGYLLDLVAALRIRTGAATIPSPRAAQILAAVARAFAALDGAPSVTPDHVKTALIPTMAHRCTGTAVDLDKGRMMVAEALERVPVPVAPAG